MGTRYILTPDGELYHWGIKGMKWGQRRYQNKDGSLTPAGKKRYAQEEAALKEREKTIKNREREAARRAKMDAKKADLDAREASLSGSGKKPAAKTETSQHKSVKDMTDDEIRTAIARKQLESQYLQYHPQPKPPESFGKRFINEAVKPAAIAAGKDFIEKSLKKMTGDILKDKIDPKSLAGIEAANKKLRAQIENDLLKSGIDPNIKSENLDKWVKFNEERKAKTASKSAQSDPKDSASKKTSKSDTNAKSNPPKEPKVTVEGKGASQKKNNTEHKKSDPIIIDAEPDDSGTYTAAGREYLDLLLYDPYRRSGG